ncbi:MAG: hypothetical protein QF926_14750 [Alphaproteobacteria bacterium]|nr:hypothetical protein [Alphaproteobacteria bacterium]MDP6517862.1 hypothetical protein [Alphaproteobacteria bacterium]
MTALQGPYSARGKGFHDWDRQAWTDGVIPNMIAPIELIRLFVDGMIERRFGRIVARIASAVRAGLGLFHSRRT